MLGKGKRTKEWEDQRKKLKEIYLSKGITSCELHLEGCMRDNYLSFAHRHKRSWYWSNPELLGSFQQTLLACIPCHNKIEYKKELTEELFNKLRGEE
jgi:hypothetical protein